MQQKPSTAPVLTSWKEIARYLGKGVRTVQRWEQDFGLPVRRPQGSDKKAVLARPSDLDAWIAIRCGTRTTSHEHQGVQAETVCVRSAIAVEIETSRILRTHNRTLRTEIRTAINALQEELSALRDRAA